MALVGILPPYPVLALVGAQVASPRCPILRPGIFSLSHSIVMVHFLLLGSPINGGRRKFLFPCRPDCLNSTGQLIHRSDVGNRAVHIVDPKRWTTRATCICYGFPLFSPVESRPDILLRGFDNRETDGNAPRRRTGSRPSALIPVPVHDHTF